MLEWFRKHEKLGNTPSDEKVPYWESIEPAPEPENAAARQADPLPSLPSLEVERSDVAPSDAPVERTPDSAAARQVEGERVTGDPPLAVESQEDSLATPVPSLPRRKPMLAGRRAGRALVKPEERRRQPLTAQQRLLILDSWNRSGLPAGDFAAIVGVSKHTLYAWKKAFESRGPEGLMEGKRGAKEGSRLPDLTKRTILMLKAAHPDWGCQRIVDALTRGPALGASPSAVSRVLREAGYELVESPTRPHPDKPRFFERAKPNQLWQTDLFTFILKRQNRRVYLVAFMDDHSRFVVSYGLHASQSTALTLEVLRAGIASYQAPEEVLTDNGAQYITWRGKGAFTKELERRGIKQIVARPRHPQTLGKIERFWGTLWRECVEAAIFLDLEDARRRIGLFIDSYNFQRPHQGIDGLTPADRFFNAAPEVLKTLQARVVGNALELARNGTPKPPFYVTGQVGAQSFSVHAEGERVILTREGGAREEVDLARPTALTAPAASVEPPSGSSLPAAICPDGSPLVDLVIEEDDPAAPGVSSFDAAMDKLQANERGTRQSPDGANSGGPS